MKTPVWNDCNGTIDINSIYECPMIRKGTVYPNEIEDIVSFKFKKYPYGGGYTLVPLNDNYLPKFFYDLHTGWLIYTGYIKKIT